MTIYVGIIENDLELADELSKIINGSEKFKCDDIFHNTKDAIENIPKLQLDVVLTDIHIGCKSGIDCIKELSLTCKSTLFIVSTTIEDTDVIFKALQAGAIGYILKSEKPSVLLEAIREAYNGGGPMSSKIARKVVQSFHSYVQHKELEKLSIREQEVLDYLSKGLRYDGIANVLCISTSTVRKHIYNIYQKLQVNSKLQAINKVYKKW